MPPKLDKEDSYIQVFMGSSYKFGQIGTVAELKSLLEQIAADLPADGSLEISEVDLTKNRLTYTLREGITQ